MSRPACLDLTDQECDVADALLDALRAHRGQDYSPSQAARAAKVSTAQAHRVLPALLADQYVTVAGNGAWRRYQIR